MKLALLLVAVVSAGCGYRAVPKRLIIELPIVSGPRMELEFEKKEKPAKQEKLP